MQSAAKTVAEYLASLPEERRAVVEAVRKVVRKNIDKTFAEGMQYGMIGYYVPHKVFATGYHCDPSQPLPFAALAAQKNFYALYLMCLYQDSAQLEWFVKEWAKTGKKLDMGKSCLRFKKLDDLSLELIGQLFSRISAKEFISQYEAATAARGTQTKTAPKQKASPVKKK